MTGMKPYLNDRVDYAKRILNVHLPVADLDLRERSKRFLSGRKEEEEDSCGHTHASVCVLRGKETS